LSDLDLVLIPKFNQFIVPHGNKFKFSTVNRAGHEVPTYKPEQAYILFNTWLAL